jgi:hypothetical protein
MNPPMDSSKTEIAATAARLVVEEGLEYGPAKRRAVKLLGLPARTAAAGQRPGGRRGARIHRPVLRRHPAGELLALRRLALVWMERMAEFRPHLAGSVWHGTATRLSDIYIQLFCDDPKSAEIALIDHHVDYEPRTVTGFHGEPVEALSLGSMCRELERIGVHLMVYDLDDLRGALKPDAKGPHAPRRPDGRAPPFWRDCPP